MPFSYLPRTLSPGEAAVFLRVPVELVQEAMTDGSLPTVDVAGATRIDTRRLLALMGAEGPER